MAFFWEAVKDSHTHFSAKDIEDIVRSTTFIKSSLGMIIGAIVGNIIGVQLMQKNKE